MAAQPLGPAVATLLLNGLEHVREIARIVSGARHDLHADNVGLTLVLAAVFHQPRAKTKLRSLRDHFAPAASDHRAGDRAS